MNLRSTGAAVAVCSFLLAGLMMWAGCEADSSKESVVISPQSVVVRRGQTVQFQASGGYDYKWSLSPDDGSGALNTFMGDTVIYTCLATNIGSWPKKVMVTSTIEGSSTGSTNTPAYSAEAFAEIYSSAASSTSTSTNSP